LGWCTSGPAGRAGDKPSCKSGVTIFDEGASARLVAAPCRRCSPGTSGRLSRRSRPALSPVCCVRRSTVSAALLADPAHASASAAPLIRRLVRGVTGATASSVVPPPSDIARRARWPAAARTAASSAPSVRPRSRSGNARQAGRRASGLCWCASPAGLFDARSAPQAKEQESLRHRAACAAGPSRMRLPPRYSG